MKTIFILVVIYLVSTFFSYKYMQIAHSEKGRWKYLDIGVQELFITFCPIMNSLFVIIAWVVCPPYRKENKDNNFNSFFKVKK